ncbi:sterol carrier protein domain-containing protein [Cytobacillus purgationiresistens]|uniref:Acetyltransferase n=1 Tax=Cytobacillus purgationiresistens TaxID=863449 RepID=A0ABU0AME1_9BACI|nr:sterol carrier protein domain-containing protein [Cytobacillus purgationiresistens]MDQ0272402.1 putative acetyltransferase [Cytobacillus purgationiresistens]
MGRIVDVGGCLQQYDFIETPDNVILHIKDQYAAWNNRCFSLKGEAVDCEGQHPKLELSINALSSILIGHKRPIDLYQMGEISGTPSDVGVFEKKIPHLKTLFYDFF